MAQAHAVCEEPADLKAMIKRVRRALGEENYIDWDSLAVWSFNALPKYLWRLWKDDLTRKGISWQVFLKILRTHTADFIEWALRDYLSWDDLLKKVKKSLDSYGR